MMNWIDISQTLSPGLVMWPGDPPFEVGQTASFKAGDAHNVGRLHLGLHSGTHVDAPLHFRADGADVASCALDIFVGPARVIDLEGRRALTLDMVNGLETEVKRLLIKTGSGVEAGWHETFACLEEEAALELVRRGITLVGIDTPSVDPASSVTWPVHRQFAAAGVVILENLKLDLVRPGWYELVALPLKLSGLEASPVRAVVRPL